MSNLENSTRVITAILGKLLEMGISGEMLEDSELGLSDDERKISGACFDWLENEGLVRCANTAHAMGGSAWIAPTLTSRGFAIMDSPLQIEGDTLTVAEAVQRDKDSSLSYGSIGEFLGSALGGFTKSIGS